MRVSPSLSLLAVVVAAAMAGSCAAGNTSGTGYCGDGVVDTDLGEECDDGNAIAGDGCSPTCIGELGAELDCANGLDDDQDGLTDCDDPGCATHPSCVATTETSCSDGVDNDGDGLIDCDDGDCALNPLCQTGGEVVCDNGLDDDADGVTDCGDSDCDGRQCGANGRVCQLGHCVCSTGLATEVVCTDGVDDDCDGLVDCIDPDCAGAPSCQGTENICNDGVDNDGDGSTDCLDADCAGAPCGTAGRICAGGTCACPGGSNETLCTDGVDNDCDGAIDCADPDCALNPACVSAETNCSDSIDNDNDGSTDCLDADCTGQPCDTAGRICSGGTCTCPGGSSETQCTDGVDNDCDGFIDCADSDCSANPSCVSAETNCTNGVDDDGDGFIDCADSDCNGTTCGSFGLICTGGGCNCPGGTTEVCGNGVDDNCNGQADENCGGGTCTDAHPYYIDCPAGQNCVPQPGFGSAGICESPVGTGTQYSLCLSRTDCAPGFECVNGLSNTYCMQWCSLTYNDCIDIWDSCYSFTTPLYLGTMEWGGCWDGWM